MLVDFEVIKRAQSGDGAAFNEIVLAYRKRILGTIARLIGRPEDVEDVGQEVFLRLYFALDQLRTAEVFEPWLYRLTVNAAYDYLRKQKRRPDLALPLSSFMSAASKQNSPSGDAPPKPTRWPLWSSCRHSLHLPTPELAAGGPVVWRAGDPKEQRRWPRGIRAANGTPTARGGNDDELKVDSATAAYGQLDVCLNLLNGEPRR